MSNIVISVENLSKIYRLGQIGTGTFRNDLKVWWAKMRGKPNPLLRMGETDYGNRDGEDLWALRDVSFTVKQGEVLGIIGRNGAGKSTLLKILSRVTAPTYGRIRVKGRVASLLEVGTGFHPELTGRENIYLNGAILGMNRKEIDRKFDEIISFAEIERFIDTPVKRYSSGMYVRLAFAVAAHLEPEILVIDEVLAVGDTEFQKKCLGKMGDAAKGGKTVLFVSHNMPAVQRLCNRIILLNKGATAFSGDVADGISIYLATNANNVWERSWDDLSSAPGNHDVRIQCVKIVPKSEKYERVLDIHDDFTVEITYLNQKAGAHLNLSMLFYNQEDACVFATTTILEKEWYGKSFPKGSYRNICSVPGNFLNAGVYRVHIMVVQDSTRVLFRMDDALIFEIQDSDKDRGAWFGKWPGVVRPQLHWTTELIDLGTTK